MKFAVGGDDLDGGGGGGKAFIARHLDLAAQRGDFRIVHASRGELLDAGLASDERGGDRVLHADL